MVLVTAANGKIGRLIIKELVRKKYEVRALDINPAAETLKELGVREVVIGDACDPKIVREAVRGIEAVVYQPAMLLYSETEMADLCIDESIAAGVSQFIMLSVAHPNLSTILQHTMKLKAEEHLKLQGFKHNLNFTILQPLHYMHNILVKQMLETGVYPNFKPLHKKLGYVADSDVAEVVGIILSEKERHRYATYELCGSSHLSIVEIAELFTKITGRNLTISYTERENLFRDFPNFAGIGNDSYSKAAFMSIRDTYNEYGFDANCNVLEWLLGRRSTTVEEYIKNECQGG